MLKGKELFEMTHRALNLLGKNPKMLELGSQGIQVPDVNEKIAKKYFKSIGVEHVSIDLNGMHGSLKFDLAQPIYYVNNFDIVTNFGTSEHIHDQYMCFLNIHCFCKVGGIMIHSVPLPKHWPMHCPYHYPMKFFDELANIANYEILEKKIVQLPGGPPAMQGKRGLACAILEKKDCKLFKKEEFRKLPIVVEDYKVNHNNLKILK